MTEHYTRNTESILKWCNRCDRLTVHAVSDGRVGRCTEHGPVGESKKQTAEREKREREAANPRML